MHYFRDTLYISQIALQYLVVSDMIGIMYSMVTGSAIAHKNYK